ncbi:MAG: carbohydrate binding domain-containing protein [Thermoguttaceae bacterium]
MVGRQTGQFLAILLALSIRWSLPARGGEPYLVPLRNSSFSEGTDDRGVPRGWSKYAGGGEDQKLELTEGAGGDGALLIADGDRTAEIGVIQTVELKRAETYEVSVKVRGVEGASSSGAYLQLRFIPSNEFVQTALSAPSTAAFSDVSVKGTAPPGTTQCTVYLYTHRETTPRVLVTDVRLAGGVPAPPPPPPEPVPPQYDKLKDMHPGLPLVHSGKAGAAIVVPRDDPSCRRLGTRIQQVIEDRSGVRLPIVSDDWPHAGVPLQQNLVLLGNRSTNEALGRLYDHHFCLVDLKYPGPEGYAIRTVHNPYGNGNSALIVGASDQAGLEQGVDALTGSLSAEPRRDGELSIGWTMKTKLGKGQVPPVNVKDFQIWDASRGYGSVGYFGWCSISKQMAM